MSVGALGAAWAGGQNLSDRDLSSQPVTERFRVPWHMSYWRTGGAIGSPQPSLTPVLNSSFCVMGQVGVLRSLVPGHVISRPEIVLEP